MERYKYFATYDGLSNVQVIRDFSAAGGIDVSFRSIKYFCSELWINRFHLFSIFFKFMSAKISVSKDMPEFVKITELQILKCIQHVF